MFENLRLETPLDHVELVTLSRPAALNALSTQLCDELAKVFSRFHSARRRGLARVVVLTGEGKAFCAGADLKQRKALTTPAWLEQHHSFEAAAKAIAACPVPLIAAVNGPAFGGGCELALLADLVLASESAVFAQPEVKLGIIPGMGGTQRLPRRIGPLRAAEMLFTGRRVEAREAADWGLVNRVTAPGALVREAVEMAGVIAANGPVAVREAKRAMMAGAGLPVDKAYAVELRAYQRALRSGERIEGMRAFHEKRRPAY